MELPSRYDHTKEDEIYAIWEKSGYFNPERCIKDGVTEKDAKPFSMVLPPPNVTGTLHMGHAAMLAVEDALVRYWRMRGKRTLWIPGTDHAAIATHAKVEDILYKEEGKRRIDLDKENPEKARKKFLELVEDFAKKSQGTIVNQVKRMGSSLDWSREAFTLDPARERAVVEAFQKLAKKDINPDGLDLLCHVFRPVKWDPIAQTVIDNEEVFYKETDGKLYTFRYSEDFPIPITTTRPETKVGDVAVAVHPSDERYKELIDTEYDIEDFADTGRNLHIRIVKDESVDKSFGTGAVGVTPIHSEIDFEIAQRNNLLPQDQREFQKFVAKHEVIDRYVKMNKNAGNLEGMTTINAGKEIIKRLEDKKLLDPKDMKNIKHNVPFSERTGARIEPLTQLQWFIAVNKEFVLPRSDIKGIKSGEYTTLKKLIRAAVENGQIEIIPERFKKIYFHWIDNLHDWCISRQIWYGHRIPYWYRNLPEKFEERIQIEEPEGEGWEQDQDTLDTWFSSGLWTLSTLGWPEETEDLKTYHPTSVLETGYDILFFWVARMILMTGALVGQIPFKKVYLHGLVRDEKGKKMSKSLGNTIDPLLMADKYGADATRLSLIMSGAPGNDISLSEDRIRGYRNFATKIWNAARFILMNKPLINPPSPKASDGQSADEKADKRGWKLSTDDKKHLEELSAIKKEVAGHIENFELHLAAEKAYHYFWHTFADKIIEEKKSALKEGSDDEKAAAYALLEHILIECLTMLHPFMPFVTEAVYQNLRPGELLMVRKWE